MIVESCDGLLKGRPRRCGVGRSKVDQMLKPGRQYASRGHTEKKTTGKQRKKRRVEERDEREEKGKAVNTRGDLISIQGVIERYVQQN